MPSKPKRPCNKPGCPNLTDTRYCDAHKDAEQHDRSLRNKWRGSAARRGYDAAHRKLREQVLKEQKYLCKRCLDVHGRVSVATDLHHYKKITTHPHLRLERSNVVGCCSECHEELEKLSI